jgi:hypothetical protein
MLKGKFTVVNLLGWGVKTDGFSNAEAECPRLAK